MKAVIDEQANVTYKQTNVQTNRQTERSNILAKMYFRQVMNLKGAGL